jgi:catechol 2,3-dioxygenase-like lactoylglutathione lyase family enzyme
MHSAQLNGIHAIMLGVREMAPALAFYRDTLGLKVKMQEAQIALLEAGHITLGLSLGHIRMAPQVAGAIEVVFRVDNVRGVRETLAARGVTFLSEPRQATPTDWVAHFKDPDGHLLSIFGPEGEDGKA